MLAFVMADRVKGEAPPSWIVDLLGRFDGLADDIRERDQRNHRDSIQVTALVAQAAEQAERSTKAVISVHDQLRKLTGNVDLLKGAVNSLRDDVVNLTGHNIRIESRLERLERRVDALESMNAESAPPDSEAGSDPC